MSISSEELGDNSEETKEVASASSETHDTAVFSPRHLSDSPCTFLDVNSILWFFKPGVGIEEFYATLTRNSNFTHIMIDTEVLNGSHERLDVWMLSLSSWSNWSKWALTRLESDE